MDLLRDYKNNLKLNFFKSSLNLIIISLSCILLIYIITPHAWHEKGFKYIWVTIKTFAGHRWYDCTNFKGVCQGKFFIKNGEGFVSNDWSVIKYLFNWISIKLTIINFFSLLSALFIFPITIISLKSFRNEIKYSSKLITSFVMGMQLFFIPIGIILSNSGLYNGIRHILFIFPALAYFGSYSIHFLESKLKGKKIKLFLSTLLISSAIFNFLDIISLSPYQYTYINEFNRGKNLDYKITEIDYWAASTAELFKNSRAKTDLFPYKGGMGKMFLEVNKLNVLEDDDKFSSFIEYRKKKRDPNLKCKKVASVSKNYIITREKFDLSNLLVCGQVKK